MFQPEIHPDAEEEIYYQAKDYSQRFSTGEEDFITAVSDTLEEIEQFPNAGQRRFPDRDPDIRSRKVRFRKGSKGYARQFPFAFIYKTYEHKAFILVYHL